MKAAKQMNFFAFGASFCTDGSEFYFEPDETVSYGQAPTCNTCGNVYGMLPLEPPVRGTIVAEKRMFDLAATTANELLISAKCREVFNHAGITGVSSVVPIEVTRIDGPKRLQDHAREYFLVGVELWGAEVDRLGSRLQTTLGEVCPTCGYAGIIEGYDRIRIVERSWKGSDLFTVKGLPVVLATERVADLCREFNLAVCSLVPAEDCQMPFVSTRLPLD